MNIMRGLPLVLGVVLCGVLTGCVNRFSPLEDTVISPLEVRAVQTRTYEGSDAKATLKTVMNVLQDEGYIVDYGDAELGLLHASRTLGSESFFLRPNTQFNGTSTMDATVNVSDFGKQIKVRVSFQQKIDSWGGTMRAFPIGDAQHYQDFFAKLERGLFIQKQGL